MKIVFYNVDHGSCSHIITPLNQHILVDVGSKPDKSIAEYIKNKYSRFGIDNLIITHPHEDHIYDLPKLYEILTPRMLTRPKDAFDIVPSKQTPLHIAIADYANRMNRDYNCPVAPENDPKNENNNGGVHFTIIYPKSEWTDRKNLNTFSPVIVVMYCGYKFVLTGDNPSTILNKMMEDKSLGIKEAVRDATVLLAPHHGRSGEFCEEFFKVVNPKVSVISDKSIVHETQYDSSSLYAGTGLDVDGVTRYTLTTRKDGTITFDFDQNHFSVKLDEEGY